MGKDPLKNVSPETRDQARQRFKVFDLNTDGLIDKNEFKVAITKDLKERDQSIDDETLDKCFRQIDSDNSGGIDEDEFIQGYSIIIAMFENPDQWRNAIIMDTVVDSLPGGSTLKDAAALIESVVEVGPAKVKKDENSLLVPPIHPSSDGSGSGTTCALFGVVFLILLFAIMTNVWTVVFWIGVASGEDCDKPLRAWVLGEAILSTVVGVPIVCVALGVLGLICAGSLDLSDLTAKAQSFKSNANKASMSTSCCSLFGFVWFILGAVWFCDAGGLWGDSSKSDCITVAPTLWGICFYYWYITLISVCCTIPCFCCLCIAVICVAKNGSFSESQMSSMVNLEGVHVDGREHEKQGISHKNQDSEEENYGGWGRDH